MNDFGNFSEKEIGKYVVDKIKNKDDIDEYLKWMYDNNASPKSISKMKKLYSDLSGKGLKSFEDFISKIEKSWDFSTIHSERKDFFSRIENENLREILNEVWEDNYNAFNSTIVAMWKIGNDKEIIDFLKKDRKQLHGLIAILNFLFGLRELISFKFLGNEEELEKNMSQLISFIKKMIPELSQQLKYYE